MTDLVTDLNGDPIPEAEMRYLVECWGGNINGELDNKPLVSLQTIGGWNIEGDFLCVYNNNLKQAYLLPDNVLTITTKPIKPDPLTDPIEVAFDESQALLFGEGGDLLLETTQPHDMEQELKNEE